jgi:hypothetical protein
MFDKRAIYNGATLEDGTNLARKLSLMRDPHTSCTISHVNTQADQRVSQHHVTPHSFLNHKWQTKPDDTMNGPNIYKDNKL